MCCPATTYALFTVTLDPLGNSTVTQAVLEANTPLLPAG